MNLINKIFGQQEEDKKEETPKVEKIIDENEIYAAIGTAIHLYQKEVHDFENYVMTIKRIDKIYSPWSSKVYQLRRWPK